jgi:peptide/nickel transport system permease protein
LLLLFALVSGAIGAPLVARLLDIDPQAVDLLERFQAPSAKHPLGTDELGRDLLLRLLYGGQVSLLVGLFGALGAALIGTLVGVVSGYAGGRLDSFLMRVTDAVVALPLLPLLIVLAALDLQKLGLSASAANAESISLFRIALIVALFGWTTVARLVRSATLSLRERDFVSAARVLGVPYRRIIRVHVLPNVLGPVVVATTLAIGNVILLESVLSFLGLGVQPPLASWGNMLSNAQELVWSAPRLAILPGLMIFLTVLSCNFLGDSLQEALDPRGPRGGPGRSAQ